MRQRRHPPVSDPPQRRWVVLGLVLALHVAALAAMFLAAGAPHGFAGAADRQPAMLLVAVPAEDRTPPPRPPMAAALIDAAARAAAASAPDGARPRPAPPPSPAAAAPAASAIAGAAAMPAAAAPASPAPAALLPAAPPDTPANDALAAYRQQLWREIRAHRPYGTVARGTVAVAFRVGGDGALLDASIAASSGDPALDRIALRTVRQAAPFPPPPAGAALPLAFVVPLDFR